MSSDKRSIAEDYLLLNKEEMIRDLFTLCRIPSVGDAAKKEAPFGLSVHQLFTSCAQLFSEAGCLVETRPEYLCATLGKGEKTIGIFTHGDVVPAEDDWLYTKPFSPVIKNGAAIGRGVEDNKGGIVAALYVLKAARYAGILPKKRWLVFVGGDEERSMRDIDAFLLEHPSPDVSLVPDNDFPVCYAEKGIMHFDALSKKEASCLLDAYGGSAYNMIPGEAFVRMKKSRALTEELKTHTASSKTVTLKEEDSSLLLTAHGIPGHAAAPSGTSNAIFLLFSVLSRLSTLSDEDRTLFSSIASLSESCYGEVFHIDSSDPVFGPLTCVSSLLRFNEGKLSLGFDIRYGKTYTGDAIKHKIQGVLESLHFSGDHFNCSDGFDNGQTSPVLQLLMASYRSLTGDEALPYTSSGGTYARKLKNAYSIGTHYPNAIPSFLPSGHGHAHQKDEALDIDAFLMGTKLLLRMLLALDDM